MKTVLKCIVSGLLIFELLSPFMIGYIHAATKTPYVIKTEKNQAETKPETFDQATKIADLDLFDESFSDSKSLRSREMLSQGE